MRTQTRRTLLIKAAACPMHPTTHACCLLHTVAAPPPCTHHPCPVLSACFHAHLPACRFAAGSEADPNTDCLLLAGCMDGSVHVLHAAAGRIMASAKPHSKYVVGASWAPALLVSRQQQQKEAPGQQLIATSSWDSSCCLLQLVRNQSSQDGQQQQQQLSLHVVQQVCTHMCLAHCPPFCRLAAPPMQSSAESCLRC